MHIIHAEFYTKTVRLFLINYLISLILQTAFIQTKIRYRGSVLSNKYNKPNLKHIRKVLEYTDSYKHQ